MSVVGCALATELDQNCFQNDQRGAVRGIRALVQAGAIEARGDFPELRNAQVRLPDSLASNGAAAADTL
jgi:hypothetical protein